MAKLISELQRGMVSVLVPNFNSGGALARAIKSVVSQTYSNLEIIIWDDGSSDDSLQLLDLTDPRIQVFVNHTNSGSPSIPRNLAAAEASGNWVAFLDSDDYWHPTKIEQQISMLNKNKSRACASNAQIVRNGEILGPYFTSMPERATRECLIKRNYVITSSVLVERKLLESCLPFPNAGPSIYEDLAVWLRIATEEVFLIDNQVLLNYTDHSSGSFKSQYGNHFQNLRVTFQNYVQWLGESNRRPTFRFRFMKTLALVNSTRSILVLARGWTSRYRESRN